jgi:integrase
MTRWYKTEYRGIRYRKHPKRKHGVKFDRYYAIRYQRDGKRKEEGIGWASGGWTLEKVALQLAELKQANKTGEGPARLSDKREIAKKKEQEEKAQQEREAREAITFSQFFTDTYFPIAKRNKKRESYRKEKEHFNNWLEPVLGKMPLKKIYALNLEKVKKNMLDAELSPRSLQYVFATFRQIWNMAKRDGIITTESPSKQVKLPKVNNERLRFLTHEEANSLMDNLKSRSMKLHNIALLSLHCGLRASEIFRLKWQNIDLNQGDWGVIMVHGKGNKSRPAFMTNEVKAMFESLEQGSPDSPVFTDRKGNQIASISNAFDRAVSEVGLNDGITDPLNKFTFHCLRHTFASWIVQSGESLYTVKELLGHSTMAMTERYSHLASKNLKNAVKKLEDSMKTTTKESEKETQPEAVEVD